MLGERRLLCAAVGAKEIADHATALDAYARTHDGADLTVMCSMFVATFTRSILQSHRVTVPKHAKRPCGT
jgi:hypothetical protein